MGRGSEEQERIDRDIARLRLKMRAEAAGNASVEHGATARASAGTTTAPPGVIHNPDLRQARAGARAVPLSTLDSVASGPRTWRRALIATPFRKFVVVTVAELSIVLFGALLISIFGGFG